jgi:hypothetical protein
VAKRGKNVSFFREICPRKKCTPNIGAKIGDITGILLKEKKWLVMDDDVDVVDVAFAFFRK